ncbi:E3 ubiquitin-protein ligase TRIM7-like isoform X2 [Rana temporaria]|uniref:E3 ubiquitin-protein ligase TRIM7-like isoform X2 n=1 Tax=Rana temporaria TaxID=8407 RepID=UPI001AAD2AD8|nr:E3 ubiquitin-protein ligase TRIM7-like isoform X2 [Rana temporaria]
MENGKSFVHQEYYFTEDSACICKSCGWAQGQLRKQEGTPDGTPDKKKKTKLITLNVEEVGRCLQEPRREQGKAASETERARALTTSNFENVTRCLQEPNKSVQGKAASETERARELSTSNIENVTRCLQEPSRRAQGKAASETERARELRTSNIGNVTRCLQEPSRRAQGKAASETERARELCTSNNENVTRCLQEPSRRTQSKAASETERARELSTSNIENITRCLQEPNKRVQGKAANETKRARELRTSNIENVTRCLQEPSRRAQGKAASETERARELRTSNIENVTRCLQEPNKRVQGKAANETKRARALASWNVEDISRRLQESRSRAKDKAASETERAKTVISDFKRWLEDLRETILNAISSQKQISVSDLIHQLEIKNDEWSKINDPIKELVGMTDPLTVLQESDRQPTPVSDNDTEDRDEGGKKRDELPGSGVGWGKVEVSHTLGSPYILTGVNGHIDLPEPVDILLDENTAHNILHLLDDRKTASWSFINKNLPDTPERFAFRPQVLSSQSFFTGRHCWDVEVQRSDNWRVGMCYPSIDRKGGIQSVIGNNKKSWCFSRSHDGYFAIHDGKKVHLFGSISSGTVRVSLDYESGLISFYELGISVRCLHTFTATFTEPLHAAIGVWRGCIKMSGRKSGGAGNLRERSNPMG